MVEVSWRLAIAGSLTIPMLGQIREGGSVTRAQGLGYQNKLENNHSIQANRTGAVEEMKPKTTGREIP